jgi:hypothetical protein
VVPNATVNWSTTLGNLSSATSVTNASGIAVITLSGTVAGAAIVSAISDAGIARNVNIQFEADPSTANIYSMSASSTSMPADVDMPSPTQNNLYAQLSDANGNPLGAGITVNWSTNGYSTFALDNFTQNISSQTDLTGKATIPFYVGETGSYTVIAEYNGVSQNIVINAIPRIVSILSFRVEPTSLNQDETGAIYVNLDGLVFGDYKAYIDCEAGFICQDVNGQNITPDSINVTNTAQFRINVNPTGQVGFVKFNVRINNGQSIEIGPIEVTPPPN